MTVLAACFAMAAVLTIGTGLLLLAPTTSAELRIWRRVRVSSLRRWLTRTRHVEEPLDSDVTTRIARRNLYWHLVLTGLFAVQLGIALGSVGAWWRPFAAVLVVPCLAYFLGSVVQRQKIAVIQMRSALHEQRQSRSARL